MLQSWPVADPAWADTQAKEAMEAVMDVIRAIRARRAEMNVPPSKKAEVLIVTATPDVYAQGSHFIQRLAYASDVKFADTAPADVPYTEEADSGLPQGEAVPLD